MQIPSPEHSAVEPQPRNSTIDFSDLTDCTDKTYWRNGDLLIRGIREIGEIRG
jgi:hypothetical protein